MAKVNDLVREKSDKQMLSMKKGNNIFEKTTLADSALELGFF